MSAWRRMTRGLYGTPVTVTHTVPPADVVPAAPVLDDTPEATALEAAARIRHAAHRVERELWAQSARPRELRNAELVDFLLDQRATLRPSPPGSEVLREVPPVPARYPVPVIPGGAS